MLHHINKLIDIAQIQAGALWLDRKAVNLLEVTEQVIENWREQLESKGLALEVSLPEVDLWIEGDPQRLSWAIDNLLNNAYSYTIAGRVEVVLSQKGEEARLDVVDTGIGVAAANQPYLFTRFFRAGHDETYDVAGVGLGLYITRSLIEAHGGRAWAESELGVGSTFSLALPLQKREVKNR